VPWEEYEHPQFGSIEVGGFKKNFGRLLPGFLLEQDAHRNMAFTVYHGYHTPKLTVSDVQEEDVGGGLKSITATVQNERLIPTHSSQDLKFSIKRPDIISLKGVEAIRGMVLDNVDFNKVTEQIYDPGNIRVKNIPGKGTVKARWIVRGNRNYRIQVDSGKGRVVEWKP
jgi:hypothetical protein